MLTEKTAVTTSNANNSPVEQFVLLAKSAKGAGASELIKQALEAPGVYVFGELLEMPNIKDVSIIVWIMIGSWKSETANLILAGDHWICKTPATSQSLCLWNLQRILDPEKWIAGTYPNSREKAKAPHTCVPGNQDQGKKILSPLSTVKHNFQNL